MADQISIYKPRTLAEVVRLNPPTHTFLRDTFFNNVKTFVTESVDIDLVKGDRRMAAIVHPMVGGEIVREVGYETKRYTPPLVNPATATTAGQLLHRLPGEDLYSGRTPADRAAEKLTEDYRKLDDMVTRREEWMAAQALTTGSIHCIGKGVDQTIDFGFTNKETLTSTKKWNGTAKDILGDLRRWKKSVQQNGFANCNMAIFGSDAADALKADETILKLLDNRRYELGRMGYQEEPNGVTWFGYLADPGLDLYTYDEVYTDNWTDPEDPETKPLIPAGMVLLLPRNASFMRAYGLCTYLDDGGAWVAAETARLLRSYVEHRPDRRMLEVQSHPLMIPDKVDSWFAATVL